MGVRWGFNGRPYARSTTGLRSGNGRNLNQKVRIGQPGFNGRASGGRISRQPRFPLDVHRIEVGDVAKVYGGGEQTGFVAARFREQFIDPV